ncbi:J domain-containing protein [Halomonas koreensis]|uniref:J domain-containing protein n=1 Tax=Halomonas koreensis TaxID=245385 RepID=A0ABU1G4N0_9GAMM|nr:J domain-containing protein [Halomonas koreensis]MDR5867473.1 J domain-containing protein [Halomonas koreensis]
MTATPFSTFELLLLQSRDQADSAALLLLCWVLTHRGTVGEAERAHLVALTGAFRHGHDLAPVLEVAASQDLSAIQLAAEVLQKELHGESARAFLRLAITLATDGDEPTLANHHVLRFLADLLGVAPAEFAALYASQAGRRLAEPDDPSQRAYWRRREGRAQDTGQEGASRGHHEETAEAADDRASRRAERAEARRQAREAREEAKRQRQAARREAKTRRREEREAARQRKQAQREAERRRRQAQREARRHERERAGERQRHDDARQREEAHRQQEQRRRHEQAHRRPEPPPDPRRRSALSVLGLEPGASRSEIRKAYRRLAQAHHPDRFHHEGEAIVASASRRFQRIRRAYDFLMKVS